jgi:hypothetical protein
LVLPIVFAGCSTFTLAEQTGVLPIQKHRRATDETLAVLPFSFEPDDPDDASDLGGADLVKWESLLASGLDQSNIFANVITFSGDESQSPSDYVLGGRITRFRFQKNWVPTFFPLHLGLSFFTFTGYTLFGGPTTATIVRFTVEFELKRVDSGETLVTFDRNYRSTRAVNVYSKGVDNPYNNPNLVFAHIVESAATAIAEALPEPAPSEPSSVEVQPSH